MVLLFLLPETYEINTYLGSDICPLAYMSLKPTDHISVDNDFWWPTPNIVIQS